MVQTCQALYVYLSYVVEKIHSFSGLVIIWFYAFVEYFTLIMWFTAEEAQIITF